MRILPLRAHTTAPRHEGIRHVADAIQHAGGCLTDVRPYADVALLLRFEVPVAALRALGVRLADVGVHLDPPSDDAVPAAGASCADVDVTLHLRFYTPGSDARGSASTGPG